MSEAVSTSRSRGFYRIAGKTVSVCSLHRAVHGLCRDYSCDEPEVPDIAIDITQRDIDGERSRSSLGSTYAPFDDGYLEELAVYRKLAEAMPAFGTVLFHGSALAADGGAYLFAAPSGTGKSTHARLWRELLDGRVVMVNDDKPLVHVGEGKAVVYGTPWDGKHRLSSNVKVPLRAVCWLERSRENRIRLMEVSEAYPLLLRQVYRPADPYALALTLDLFDQLLGAVELWHLGCSMDIDAARVSFAAMSGRSFDEA